MTSEGRTDPEELQIMKSHLSFPVVGVGASAGGLAALQRLLSGMPENAEMAVVVVMHLSPDHESMLQAILQKASKVPVIAVTQTTRIEIDHVYVISPALKLVMTDGQLRVTKLSTLEGRRQSIDFFFRSLAQAHEERAICIVLSGSGSDGAQGLKRVKEFGGVAIAQSPEDAEFDSMPLAAIQTAVVDFVLPIEEMPARLMSLWANARRIELPNPPPGLEVLRASGEAELSAEESLVSIKALLRERTGHDFAHYKRATVLRRLERRMQVNGVPDLPSYRQLLDSKPGETQSLLQDMLISVTNFYRDPQAFLALEHAVAKLVPERSSREPFRAWIAGCATGEEAYSVAIILWELLGDSGTQIQLFASDIDQRAIAAARTGLFPASIEADVSPARLRKFFIQEPAGYRICKSIRDTVIFSAHNVLSDPPFTRMDLICCRNLLIYLDRSAQAQVLKSFHFASKPRGLLLLGSSETADGTTELFHGLDKTNRLYAALPSAARAPSFPSTLSRPPVLVQPVPDAPQGTYVKPPLEVLHERVLRNHAPPTVLADGDLTVLHVSERAAHLLRLPGGAPSNNLLALARPELRAELRAAVSRAAETGRSVEAPRVRVTINGEVRQIAITASPAGEETPRGLILVVFNEVHESLNIAGKEASGRDPLVDSLESELLRTQERLRNTVGESASSTEELRASNEELQTINEELRSTTEELETSREELQAVNEELTTVNSELTLRMDETSKVNDDLQNLMISADIGTVFVDRDVKLKRFTPQAATLFNLLPADVGRPLLDITHRLDYPELSDDVTDVLRDLKRIEREIRSHDGRWFLARAVPYRTAEDRIEGAVLAFFDITSRRAAEDQLKSSEQQMRLVAESMRDYAIVTMDGDGTIVTWSPGAERIFGYDASETVGLAFDMLFTADDRTAGKPQEELRKARQFGRANDDRWHLRKDGERIFVSGITSPLVDVRFVGFAKIARDFTSEELRDRQRDADLLAERATSIRLQETATMKDEFLAVVSHELKNPLSLIRMNAQLLERLPAFASEPRAARSASAIQAAVTSQAHLINDLLELSRANMGKVVLTRSVFDLAELVGNVVQAVERDLESKSLSLSAQLQPASISADSVRVEQVVWNLITNAIKFTPHGGSIRVALTLDGDRARFSVSDSGIGLDPQHLSGIFEMFHQVETGPSRRTSGLGIGLALVKQLTELHGGQVGARSEGLGKGATFEVWFPLSMGEAPSACVASPCAGMSDMTLLLVDDEPELLGALGLLLESVGAKVMLASRAEDGLALALAQPFDVIVSDIAMPVHDGYWFARQLRLNAATREVPLVAVSGMSRPVDRARAMDAGFDAHLAKPFELASLQTAIDKALEMRGRGRVR